MAQENRLGRQKKEKVEEEAGADDHGNLGRRRASSCNSTPLPELSLAEIGARGSLEKIAYLGQKRERSCPRHSSGLLFFSHHSDETFDGGSARIVRYPEHFARGVLMDSSRENQEGGGGKESMPCEDAPAMQGLQLRDEAVELSDFLGALRKTQRRLRSYTEDHNAGCLPYSKHAWQRSQCAPAYSATPRRFT